MTTDDYRGVRFTFTPSELKLLVINPMVGEGGESLPITPLVNVDGMSDEEISAWGKSMGLNPKCLLDGLNGFNGRNVQFNIKDSKHPIVLWDDNDNSFVYIQMPMKI
jgi:DNA polymerase III sliding clamp (beta) subunit (PCNA family)